MARVIALVGLRLLLFARGGFDHTSLCQKISRNRCSKLLPSKASPGKSGGHDARRSLVRRKRRASQPDLGPGCWIRGQRRGGRALEREDRERCSLVPLLAPRCRAVLGIFTHALRDIVKAWGFCF